MHKYFGPYLGDNAGQRAPWAIYCVVRDTRQVHRRGHYLGALYTLLLSPNGFESLFLSSDVVWQAHIR